MTARLCFLFVLTNIFQTGGGISRPSTMVLENNQYKNMVIAFHESVKEDKTLIDTLKTVMGKASDTLMKATRNRAYFKEITILLPATWSDDPSYQAATTETLYQADVIISDTVRPKRSLPQTRSYNGCGKQGVHVLLPVDFLTTPRTEPFYNMPERYFVHAFAQFRWGVFQEYAETGETLFYISLSSGRPEAIRCVYYLRGLIQKNDVNQTICYTAIDPHTGLYTPDCLWRPYPTHQRVKASMMDHQWIDAIQLFCDDDEHSYMTVHNYEAPSKHNRMCGHRSTWDVITNSDDFINNRNPPVSNLSPSDLIPTFKIVKAKSRRRRAIVVIDDDLEERADIASQMIGRLRHEVQPHDMTVKAWSASDYGKKLSQAMEDGHPSEDAHVIHIKKQCSPGGFAQSGVATLISANGAGCGHLTKVHQKIHGITPGHTLADRLREAIMMEHTQAGKYIMIHHEEVKVSITSPYTASVSLDPSVGKTTQFVLHYSQAAPDIELHSPSGSNYNKSSPEYFEDTETKLVKFSFDHAQTGAWSITITSKEETCQNVTISISTVPTMHLHDPLVVRSSADIDSDHKHVVLHVDVTRENHPVCGLNVTVTVETPTGQTQTLRLYDNGAGADNSKNDGIYSRYYTQAATGGTYHFTARITGTHGTVFSLEEMYVQPLTAGSQQEDQPRQRVVNKRSVAGVIQRFVPMPSVHWLVQDAVLTGDITLPVRIVDLRVARHLLYRNTLALTWTAPGDDLDHGKVSKYELLIGLDITDVRALLKYGTSSNYTGPGRITMEERQPTAEAMKPETMLWRIPTGVVTFAFSVRGIDKGQNKAELSNVATFGIFNKELYF